MGTARATEPAPEAEEDLSAYFHVHRVALTNMGSTSGVPFDFVPLSRVIGGAENPPLHTGPDGVQREVTQRILETAGGYRDPFLGAPYDRLQWFRIAHYNTMELARHRAAHPAGTMPFIDERALSELSFRDAPPRIGQVFTTPLDLCVECARWTGYGWTAALGYRFDERMTVHAPVRRTAIDGAEYEAVPLVIERNAMPWKTYYLGYRLGVVAGKSDWQAANATHPAFNDLINFTTGEVVRSERWPLFPDAKDDFELVKLPPPFEEGDIVEYVNAVDFSDPHYFYAARQSDLDLLDAIPEWQRTGLGFKQGGYLPVCRFYGNRAKGGPNTHFYSALDADCSMLRKDEQWLDEGHPFRASLPLPTGECPQATRPLHRAYNNGAHRGIDGNHRYTLDGEILKAMTSKGWVYEGIVMCVPQ